MGKIARRTRTQLIQYSHPCLPPTSLYVLPTPLGLRFPCPFSHVSRGTRIFCFSSHCKCDRKFMTCLRRNHDETSDEVGDIYFNLLKKTCFNDQGKIVSNKLYKYTVLPIYPGLDMLHGKIR